MFLQVSVILFTGGCLVPGGSGPGGSGPRGCLLWGVPGPRGCLVLGGLVLGGCSGGCLMETPLDGYCCGWYASYWNAFLFIIAHIHSVGRKCFQ